MFPNLGWRSSSPPATPTAPRRVKWKANEEAELMRRLGGCIRKGETPGLDVCDIVAGKSKKQVQDKARNIIDKNKRKAQRED